MLRWIVNFVVTFTFRVVQNGAVGHITVGELELMTLKVDFTTKFTIQRNLCYISDCQLQLTSARGQHLPAL
jgi:hypothetical protein